MGIQFLMHVSFIFVTGEGGVKRDACNVFSTFVLWANGNKMSKISSTTLVLIWAGLSFQCLPALVVLPVDLKSGRPTAFTLMVREGCPAVAVGIVLVIVLAGADVWGTRTLSGKTAAEVVGLGGWDRGFISFPRNIMFNISNKLFHKKNNHVVTQPKTRKLQQICWHLAITRYNKAIGHVRIWRFWPCI